MCDSVMYDCQWNWHTLTFIDTFTADGSNAMNAEIYRSIMPAQIQLNASKMIGRHFLIQ